MTAVEFDRLKRVFGLIAFRMLGPTHATQAIFDVDYKEAMKAVGLPVLEPSTTPCRGCGRPMVWAMGPNGKRIPLDATSPTYELEPGAAGEKPRAVRSSALVSHFSTCPKAKEFSGGGKR